MKGFLEDAPYYSSFSYWDRIAIEHNVNVKTAWDQYLSLVKGYNKTKGKRKKKGKLRDIRFVQKNMAKKICLTVINNVLREITNRSVKKLALSDEQEALKTIKQKIEYTELDVAELADMFSSVERLASRVDEKIEIEEYDAESQRKAIFYMILGSVAGAVIAAIVSSLF